MEPEEAPSTATPTYTIVPSSDSSQHNYNDPLHLSNGDYPGMSLTTVPFNGTNFLGWSRQIKVALGAKNKLGFLDGSCHKPDPSSHDLQRWTRCDYLITCWVLNSMNAGQGQNRFCSI